MYLLFFLSGLITSTLAQTNLIEYNHPAARPRVLDENHYAAKLDGLNLHLEAAAGANGNSKPDVRSLNHCKSLAYRTLASLPQVTVKHLQNLTLSFNNDDRRGLGGGSTIILRCSNVTDNELVGVLVHEVGHIADTGVLQGNFLAGASEFKDGTNAIYNDDASLDFYRLSFLDEKTIRPNAQAVDFVSGYAMSDPFEDFAETYNYYILHGEEFRKLAKMNEILQKKYAFLKIRVFNGKEFANGNNSGDGSKAVSYVSREYDTTVQPYVLKKFFVI